MHTPSGVAFLVQPKANNTSLLPPLRRGHLSDFFLLNCKAHPGGFFSMLDRIYRARSRQGFTLIELLVVIAIIAVLIAILLPAIQKVRFVAARATSTNNLKQCGLGAHMYHDSFGFLPFNGIASGTNVVNGAKQFADPQYNQSGSWGYQILPFVDQGALYASATGARPGSEAAAVRALFQKKVAVLCCAMRERPGVCTGTGNTNYSGPNSDFHINLRINEPANGTESAANAKNNLTDIKDGTANTVFAGHGYFQTSQYFDQNGQNWHEPVFVGGNGGGGRGFTTAYVTNFKKDSTIAIATTNAGFGSPMSEGALFLFCDGSVHQIPYDVSVSGFNIGDLTAFLMPNDGKAPPIPD